MAETPVPRRSALDTRPARRAAQALLASILFAALLLASWPTPANAAQPVQPNQRQFSVLGQDVRLDDAVLSMDIPVSGARLRIGWMSPGGDWRDAEVFSVKGPHLYDLRGRPGWSGMAKLVVLADKPGVRGEVRTPGILDELRLPFQSVPYLPRLVNLEPETRFLGLPWHLWTTGAFLLLTAVAVALRGIKAASWAMPLALVVVLGLNDVRGMASYLSMIGDLGSNAYVSDIRGFGAYADGLAARAGNRSVYISGLSWPYNVHLKYRFMEVPHASKNKADLMITTRGGGIGMIPNPGRKK